MCSNRYLSFTKFPPLVRGEEESLSGQTLQGVIARARARTQVYRKIHTCNQSYTSMSVTVIKYVYLIEKYS